MSYQKYLFISTNLKAKASKFIESSYFLWLKGAEWLEIEDWLKNTPYNFLLDRKDWDKAIWEYLNKELQDIRRSVKDEIFESLLLWDFYFHNLKTSIHQIGKETYEETFYPLSFSKKFYQESKIIYQRAIKVWEETNNIFELDLFLDLQNILISERFIDYLGNKNLYSFFKFRNKLLLIKILYRARNLKKRWDEIERSGILQVKYGINIKDLYLSPTENWLGFFSGEYKNFIMDLIENKDDIDFLIKKHIYLFLKKNFSKVVSGPEVVLYYFYNKYLEGEELIFILKLKKNKVPNILWEKRVLKINV
ncbi:MAG: V-type ATPase subunit [Dictyoglomaceae bacterium]|nr:V-type ATPase subunit [Dictyoglomaceae bacterium]